MNDSFIERLRRERDAAIARRATPLDLEVPGYDGLLWARYRALPWDDIKSLIASAGDEEGLDANIDALAKACHALMIKPDGGGALVSLADTLRDEGHSLPAGVEVRYDLLAADALSLETVKQRPADEQTAALIVLDLFAGARVPELAVIDHAVAYAAWINDASQEADAELGEG